MKKILLPIDGRERSKKTIEFVRSTYAPDQVDITLVMVREDLQGLLSEDTIELAKKECAEQLKEDLDVFEGYKLKTKVLYGVAGKEIVNYASKKDFDIIIMTKSTKKGWAKMIGSVATYVVKNAKCIVMIVPET